MYKIEIKEFVRNYDIFPQLSAMNYGMLHIKIESIYLIKMYRISPIIYQLNKILTIFHLYLIHLYGRIGIFIKPLSFSSSCNFSCFKLDTFRDDSGRIPVKITLLESELH